MKIILSSPIPPPYGGIGNWTLLMHENAARFGVEILQINTSPKFRDVDDKNSLFSRMKYGIVSLFKCKKELNKLIKSNLNIDCLHIATSGSLAFFRDFILLKIAKKHKIRTVIQMRFGRIPNILRTNSWERTILKKILRVSDVVLVLDNKTKEAIREFVSCNVFVLGNPINVKITNDFLCKKDIAKYVCFAGWVKKEKGIEELLQAWRMIRNKTNDYTLKIIGPYNNEYLNYLKAHYEFDGVIFTGEISHDETLKNIANAEIFVLPSYSEGFPNVLLEAMSLKTPIVATDVGSIKDLLSDDCGICIESKNVQKLYGSLVKLLYNKTYSDICVRNAYQKCIDKYCIESIFEKYIYYWGKHYE